MGKTYDLDEFLEHIYKGKKQHEKIKLIIRSNAFKSGKLKWLYGVLPKKLENKDDLVDFIKSQGFISNNEIKIICSACTRKDWKVWINEAVKNKEIHHSRGGWR
jgi:hypothetical protein